MMLEVRLLVVFSTDPRLLKEFGAVDYIKATYPLVS